MVALMKLVIASTFSFTSKPLLKNYAWQLAYVRDVAKKYIFAGRERLVFFKEYSACTQSIHKATDVFSII